MKNNLYTLLKADEKQVRKIVIKSLKANGYMPIVTEDFIYAAGSIPVLLVAHYDTFEESPRYIKNDNGILTGRIGNKPHQLGADDRAGIYAILETIPKHHCHVLFTGGEERGGIGATAFTNSGIKPDVNYCLQFDRKGANDAVYYWADNPDFEDFISEHGWETADGTYTDICEICPYLGVMGVNLSIGYMNEHTVLETLDTEVMNLNIKRIPELLDGEKFDYIEAEYSYDYPDWYRGLYYGGSWLDDEPDFTFKWKGDRYEREEKVKEFLVRFYDGDEESEYETVNAEDYFAAIGIFLINHPTLTYRHIISCIRLAS